MLDFLQINQLIDIEVEPGADYCGRYRTRIEDINEKGIVIGMPLEKGNLVPLRKDSQVIIWHWNNNSTTAYYCKVKERIFKPLPLIFLDWPFETKKIQRRSFVRVHSNLKIEFALKQSKQKTVWHKSCIRDLSGGGTQFISKINFQKGDLLKIKLYLPDEIVNCLAKVVWVFDETQDKITRYLIGIEFNDIPEKVQDKIIKYVFARQRELIRKGVL